MIGVQAAEDSALDASVLGTDGGDPDVGKLMATASIRAHGPVELVTVDEVGDDEMAARIAMLGAPTGIARRCRGREPHLRMLPTQVEIFVYEKVRSVNN